MQFSKQNVGMKVLSLNEFGLWFPTKTQEKRGRERNQEIRRCLRETYNSSQITALEEKEQFMK